VAARPNENFGGRGATHKDFKEGLNIRKKDENKAV